MELKKTEACQIVRTIEDIKESKREIQALYTTLGLQISTFEARISTLEALLNEYGKRESERIPAPMSFSGDTIKISVFAEFDGSVEGVLIKRGYMAKEVMKVWCDRRNEKHTDFLFLYRGQLLRADQQLEMEDGDQILVVKRWT